jgi:ubiquinone/menaquinone biosynthesis C-methylase UbiE
MDKVAYEQFRNLEKSHWWFQGRRAIFFGVLDRFMAETASDNGREPGAPDPTIIDIGCGMGGMLPELSRYGRAVGFDMSEDGLRHCQERGFSELALGDGYHLPFGDAAFDLVTFFDCIEHIDDDRAVLREASRVVKPGGLVMVTVPAYQFLYSDNDVVAHHKRRYTARELKRKLRETGLEPQKTSYYNTILFPIIVPLVLLKKLKMHLFGVPEQPRSNISYSIPRSMNRLLSSTFCAERLPMRRISYPVGHSLLCVARKKG